MEPRTTVPSAPVRAEAASDAGERSNLRRVLQSTGLVGSATVAALVFGLIRSKAIALTLGPAGIGLFGVLYTLLMSGSTVVGLNLGTSGVRALAAAPVGSPERIRARAGLWSLTWLCALLGSVAFIFALKFIYVPLAQVTLSWFDAIILAIGVAALVIGAALLAVLQAEGRVAAVAAVRLWSGLAGALIGVAATLIWHTAGIYVAIVAIGLAIPAAALPYYRQLRLPALSALSLREHRDQWGTLLSIGLAITIGLFASGAGQLAIRSVLVAQGSLAVAGEFQAAMAISTANMAIVLAALAVDYFPRLAGAAESPDQMSAILADQLKVTITLAAPLLIVLAGFTDLAVFVLFSSKFQLAAGLLRWLVLGDMMKIVCWCIGYVVLARRAGIYFLMGEFALQICSVGGTWLLYGRFGLPAAGMSLIAGYFMTLAIYAAFAWRAGVRMDGVAWRLAVAGAGAIGLTGLVSARHPVAAMVLAPVAALSFGGFALFLFRESSAIQRLLGRMRLGTFGASRT